MKKSLALLLTGLIFLISCGTKTQTDGKKGNGGNITFNVEAEPTSLDPQLLTDIAAFNIDSLAYEALVRLNEKNEIVPAGAESWNISDEGKTWTFKIRQGMKWSNGDTVTANDYLRGVKRALEPETGAEYAFLMYYIEGAEDFNKGNSKDFNKVGVKVKDDYTIEFKLAKPTPYFGKLLVMPVYFPANEKVLTEHKEKYATEAGNSVYNGPYIIKEWIHDNKVVLEKNPDYWDAKNIKADTLTALMTSDYEAATNLFKNKELDFTRVSVEKKAEFDGKPELKAFPEGRVYFIGFNQNHPALKNKKVRQALSLAVNREELVSQVLNGVGIKASGIVANGMPGVNGDFREENGDLYEKYKNLDLKKLFEEGVKEAGLTPEQVNLTLLIDEKGTAKKEAEFYQAQWKEKLGIDVNVDVVTYKERISRGKEGNYEIIRYAWGPDYSDAMTYLEIFLKNAGALNFTKYNNPEYDKLVNFAKENQDKKQRTEAMQKAETILSDDFVISGLYYAQGLYLINPKLQGIVIRPVSNINDFYHVSISK
jgi:extracellular solute-binding protein family 5